MEQTSAGVSLRGVEFVSGQRGMGKTTFLRNMIETESRYVIFDHMAEFGDAGIKCYTLEEVYDRLTASRGGFAPLVLCPDPEGLGWRFEVWCRFGLCPAFPNLLLVCDEIETFAGSNRNPPPGAFLRIINLGRHFGTSFIGATRRPAEVSRALTSQAKRIVCFRQTEPADIRFLRSIVGDEALGLKQLATFEYLEFSEGLCAKGYTRA